MKYLFLVFQIVLIVLLILLVAIFVVVMFSENPEWIFDLLGVAEKGESKYEALKFLGIGMGGILIALQALMSYKRAKAMEDTAQAQADAVELHKPELRKSRQKPTCTPSRGNGRSDLETLSSISGTKRTLCA